MSRTRVKNSFSESVLANKCLTHMTDRLILQRGQKKEKQLALLFFLFEVEDPVCVLFFDTIHYYLKCHDYDQKHNWSNWIVKVERVQLVSPLTVRTFWLQQEQLQWSYNTQRNKPLQPGTWRKSKNNQITNCSLFWTRLDILNLINQSQIKCKLLLSCLKKKSQYYEKYKNYSSN